MSRTEIYKLIDDTMLVNGFRRVDRKNSRYDIYSIDDSLIMRSFAPDVKIYKDKFSIFGYFGYFVAGFKSRSLPDRIKPGLDWFSIYITNFIGVSPPLFTIDDRKKIAEWISFLKSILEEFPNQFSEIVEAINNEKNVFGFNFSLGLQDSGDLISVEKLIDSSAT